MRDCVLPSCAPKAVPSALQPARASRSHSAPPLPALALHGLARPLAGGSPARCRPRQLASSPPSCTAPMRRQTTSTPQSWAGCRCALPAEAGEAGSAPASPAPARLPACCHPRAARQAGCQAVHHAAVLPPIFTDGDSIVLFVPPLLPGQGPTYVYPSIDTVVPKSYPGDASSGCPPARPMPLGMNATCRGAELCLPGCRALPC